MTATFGQYSDKMKAAKYAFIGTLCWYTVAEATRISHADLVTLLASVGLDQFKPPVPKDEDVFRRVASGHARKHVPTADPDVFENYLIRDVKRSGGSCIKQIVVEKVDANNKRLAYAPAVQLSFDTAKSTITTTVLEDGGGILIDSPQAANLAELIVQDYVADRGSVNAYGVRELVRKVLIESNATIVRPGGGVYFVMQSKASLVGALEALGAGISGVGVHSLPLIDDEKQREMLKEAFVAETVSEVDRRLAEIDKLLAGPEISTDQYTRLVGEMAVLRSKTSEYAELLDEEHDNAEFRLTNLQRAMKKLLNHVKVD